MMSTRNTKIVRYGLTIGFMPAHNRAANEEHRTIQTAREGSIVNLELTGIMMVVIMLAVLGTVWALGSRTKD